MTLVFSRALAALFLLWRCSAVGGEDAPVSVEIANADSSVITVTADFGRQIDYPLSKSKFGGFNSGLVDLAHYERDIGLYDEVRPSLLRIDLWWGGGPWKPQPVSGTPESVVYHFDQMDRIAQLLNAHQVLPCWSYCYVPPPLQPRLGDWRRVTDNAKLWGQILGTFARHAREGSPMTKIGYHEIYNEPDNRDFFRNSREDYFGLYREGSRAIRAADPDAVIGGPALAFTPSWVPPFLEMVTKEELPLDFFSFHFYPKVWGTNSIREVVRGMRRELARQPALATTELHLNEFNSLPIDYPKGGRQDRYTLAAAMLQDYEWFLSQPDLAQVSWAQFQDSGFGNYSGMISFEGRRKAVFNAAAIYARMPVDRCPVLVSGGEDVGAMASADEHRAGVVIWNRTGNQQTLRIQLKQLPFPRGTLRVFRIDADHASWGDTPANELLTAVETRTEATSRALGWQGTIPERAVLYFEVDDGQTALRKPIVRPRIIRELHYYPDRDSPGYADLDRREWTARLGMAADPRSHQQVGALVEDLPRVVRVRVQTDGKLRKVNEDSLLGIRLDYQVGTNYTKSVLYHGPCAGNPDLFDVRRSALMPWGTRRQADRVVTVPDLGRFAIVPAEEAPKEWTGKAQITFLLQNAGEGARARFSLRSD